MRSKSPPAKSRTSAWKKTGIWISVVAAVAALCWWLRGPQAIGLALDDYADQIAVMIPRMTAALLIAGFAQVLIPRELVTKWLGSGAGVRGIFIATLAGALTPGGPMLAFPLVVLLRQSGASTTSLITFTTAWATLGFHRILMWELPFLGTEFAFVRYISSLPLPLVAGLTVLLCTSALNRRRANRP